MKFKFLATSLAVSLALSGCAIEQSQTSQAVTQQQTNTTGEGVFSQDYLLEELENGLRVMVVKSITLM